MAEVYSSAEAACFSGGRAYAIDRLPHQSYSPTLHLRICSSQSYILVSSIPLHSSHHCRIRTAADMLKCDHAAAVLSTAHVLRRDHVAATLSTTPDRPPSSLFTMLQRRRPPSFLSTRPSACRGILYCTGHLLHRSCAPLAASSSVSTSLQSPKQQVDV
jgi:hypothetical protein